MRIVKILKKGDLSVQRIDAELFHISAGYIIYSSSFIKVTGSHTCSLLERFHWNIHGSTKASIFAVQPVDAQV